MSLFHLDVSACNPQDEARVTPAVTALVDTGSELTWLPADLLAGVGVGVRRQRSFRTATGQLVTRPVGYAILRAQGFETNDEVVFAEPGDQTSLGVRTLEGFGVMVDNLAHRLVTVTTVAAGSHRP